MSSTIEISHKIGTGNGAKAPVKSYRNDPADFHKAACAAAHYAKRDGQDYAIVPGNSYGRAVYHIVDPSNVVSVTAMKGVFTVGIAKPTGEVFQATATVK